MQMEKKGRITILLVKMNTPNFKRDNFISW